MPLRASRAGAFIMTKNVKSDTKLTVENHLSEIEVVYKRNVKYADLPKIKSSQDAYEHLKSIWSNRVDHTEEFLVLFLNRANRAIGYSRISQGGVSGTVVDPKVIFQIALKGNVSSLILAHNHPSGNTQPSESDIQLTRKLKNAGAFLEIQVLDHLIITSESYYSMADENVF